MSLLGTLPTDGFVACGMIKSKKGGLVTLASSGGGGHVYRLDTATDVLTDAGPLGADDWHSFAMSRSEKVGFGTSPHTDEVVLVDVTGETAGAIASLSVDPTPGAGNDQPDAMVVHGDTLFVSLRASGKVAIVKWRQLEVVRVLELSPPASFNPANCAGCAVHGVTVRP